MAEYIIQLESRALLGQDEEFNRWYDEVHIADVLAIPGFESCKRYRIVDPADPHPRFMAAYSVRCDDPHVLLGQLFEAAKDMEVSPTLDDSHVIVTVYEPRHL
jgi:hypothetical protein